MESCKEEIKRMVDYEFDVTFASDPETGTLYVKGTDISMIEFIKVVYNRGIEWATQNIKTRGIVIRDQTRNDWHIDIRYVYELEERYEKAVVDLGRSKDVATLKERLTRRNKIIRGFKEYLRRFAEHCPYCKKIAEEHYPVVN